MRLTSVLTAVLLTFAIPAIAQDQSISGDCCHDSPSFTAQGYDASTLYTPDSEFDKGIRAWKDRVCTKQPDPPSSITCATRFEQVLTKMQGLRGQLELGVVLSMMKDKDEQLKAVLAKLNDGRIEIANDLVILAKDYPDARVP